MMMEQNIASRCDEAMGVDVLYMVIRVRISGPSYNISRECTCTTPPSISQNYPCYVL